MIIFVLVLVLVVCSSSCSYSCSSCCSSSSSDFFLVLARVLVLVLVLLLVVVVAIGLPSVCSRFSYPILALVAFALHTLTLITFLNEAFPKTILNTALFQKPYFTDMLSFNLKP